MHAPGSLHGGVPLPAAAYRSLAARRYSSAARGATHGVYPSQFFSCPQAADVSISVLRRSHMPFSERPNPTATIAFGLCRSGDQPPIKSRVAPTQARQPDKTSDATVDPRTLTAAPGVHLRAIREPALNPDVTSDRARRGRDTALGFQGALSGLPDMPRATRRMCLQVHSHARQSSSCCECRQPLRPGYGPLSTRELCGDLICVAWRVDERGKAIAAARHVLPPSPALQRITRLTPDRSDFRELIEGSDQFPV